MDHPGCGLATPSCQLQRFLHEGGLHARTHRPADDGAGIQSQPHAKVEPPLGRPHIGDISDPHLMGLRHGHLACQERGGDRLAMPTIGRPRMTRLATLDRELGLSHQPPRVGAAHRKPIGLAWLRQAAAPRGGPRLRRAGLPPRPEGGLCSPAIRRSVALHVGRKSAATDLQHCTHDGYRPPRLGLSPQGRPQLTSLAQKAAAFVHISRSMRRRFCSSRRQGSAACSGDTRPFPGKVLSSRASCSRLQRPSLVALLPTCRAALATPSPCTVTRRTASRVNSAV